MMTIPAEVARWIEQSTSDQNHMMELTRLLEERKLARASTVAEMVTGILQSSHELSRANLNSTANKLCICSRTLQKRLQLEQTSFQILLDAERFRRCKAYLTLNMSAETISELIGFADVKSLYRAFPRWTGYCLSQYLRQSKKNVQDVNGRQIVHGA
jgi:AraC-like DNA-binding protein